MSLLKKVDHMKMSSCSHSSSELTILYRQLVATLLFNIRYLNYKEDSFKSVWDRCFTEPFRSIRNALCTTSALWGYGDNSQLLTSRLQSKREEKTHINNSK